MACCASSVPAIVATARAFLKCHGSGLLGFAMSTSRVNFSGSRAASSSATLAPCE
jgi:hypothetical protein